MQGLFAFLVRVGQLKKNAKTMKKTQTSRSHNSEPDDMLPEYDFDYSKARPNRFANQFDKDHLMVILDPDVAKVFTTQESVNRALRALISAMPQE